MEAFSNEAKRRTLRARWRYWPGLVVLALIAAGALVHGDLISLWVRRDHLVGIDVSHHQGPIDWVKVRKAGVAFAFIKATEGATLTDSAFAANWSHANAAGVLRGAYHFFTFCSAGRDQAAHFVGVVPIELEVLPPLVDLELEGNCSKRPSVDELKVEIDDFLGIIEPFYRQKAIFYVTEELYARYGAVTQERELFVRELFTRPGWLDGRRWLFWQFHDNGRVDGVKGAIDLDAFHGSTEQLRALAERNMVEGIPRP